VFVCLSVCHSRFSVCPIVAYTQFVSSETTHGSQHTFRPFYSRAGTVICFVCVCVIVCSWSGWEWKPPTLAFVQKQWQCVGGNPACNKRLSNHGRLHVSLHEQVHWNGKVYCTLNSVSYITLPQVHISVCTRGHATGMDVDVIGEFSTKTNEKFLGTSPRKLLSHQLILSSWELSKCTKIDRFQKYCLGPKHWNPYTEKGLTRFFPGDPSHNPRVKTLASPPSPLVRCECGLKFVETLRYPSDSVHKLWP